MIQKMIEQVRSLVPEKIWPDNLLHSKQSSLFRMGAPKYYQGINLRPELPKQQEATQMVVQAIRGSEKTGLSATPHLGSAEHAGQGGARNVAPQGQHGQKTP